MKEPNFFVVGAPKCGTTAMYAYLGQHPDIFMPEHKEPHFFGTDLDSTWFLRDENEYRALFSTATDEKRVGEASVWYLYSKRAAAEIRRFCPSACIIVLLRNPVDVLYSLHSQFLFNGNEDIQDFAEALEAEGDRRKGLRIPRSAHLAEALAYRDIIRFAEQLERYFRTFHTDQIHVILYDDLKRETPSVYADTLDFLGVSTGFRPDFRVVNPNKRVRSKALRDFLRNPPPLGRWVGNNLIPRPIRSALRGRLERYSVVDEPRPPMDPELRRRLQSEFAPEVKRLGEILDRDLSHWIQD